MTDKIREAFEKWFKAAISRKAFFAEKIYPGDCRAAYKAGYQSRDSELRAELEAAKKDAERYRFIRDVPYSENIRLIMRDQKNVIMDAAIDAAMSEER